MPTVLFVEDEQDVLDLYTIRLEIAGFTVIKAMDGKAALDRLQESMPDVIVLDMMLPDLTGIEICRMVKSTERTRTIPVLMVSALGQESDRDGAAHVGATAFFTKPLDFDLFLEKVRDILSKKGE